jgi:plasmid stabilization system protein ParE
VLFFGWSSRGDEGHIEILRILHASMDPALHLPPGA